MRPTIIAGARAVADIALGTATVLIAWGAASSLIALGWAIDTWSRAVGGEERAR